MEINNLKQALAEQRRLAKELPTRWGKAFMKAPDIECANLLAGIMQFEADLFKCDCDDKFAHNCRCAAEANLLDYDYTFFDFWQDIDNLSNQRELSRSKAVRHIRFRMRLLRSWYLLPLLKRRYRRALERRWGRKIDHSEMDQVVMDHL